MALDPEAKRRWREGRIGDVPLRSGRGVLALLLIGLPLGFLIVNTVVGIALQATGTTIESGLTRESLIIGLAANIFLLIFLPVLGLVISRPRPVPTLMPNVPAPPNPPTLGPPVAPKTPPITAVVRPKTTNAPRTVAPAPRAPARPTTPSRPATRSPARTPSATVRPRPNIQAYGFQPSPPPVPATPPIPAPPAPAASVPQSTTRAVISRIGMDVDRRTAIWLLLGAGTAVASLLTIALVLAGLVELGVMDEPEESPLIGEIGAFLDWPLVVFIALTAAFSEEIFFRGVLQPRFGIIASSLLFGAVHFGYGTVLQVVAPFFLGLVFGFLFQRTKSLWAPIAAHFAFDFIQLTFLMLTK